MGKKLSRKAVSGLLEGLGSDEYILRMVYRAAVLLIILSALGLAWADDRDGVASRARINWEAPPAVGSQIEPRLLIENPSPRSFEQVFRSIRQDLGNSRSSLGEWLGQAIAKSDPLALGLERLRDESSLYPVFRQVVRRKVWEQTFEDRVGSAWPESAKILLMEAPDPRRELLVQINWLRRLGHQDWATFGPKPATATAIEDIPLPCQLRDTLPAGVSLDLRWFDKNNLERAERGLLVRSCQRATPPNGRLNIETWVAEINSAYQYMAKTWGMKSVPKPVLAGLVFHESGGNVRAQSVSCAYGPTQFLEPVAEEIHQAMGYRMPFQREMLEDPQYALRSSIFFLHRLMRVFGGDLAQALVAYNIGDCSLTSLTDPRRTPTEEARRTLALKHPYVRAILSSAERTFRRYFESSTEVAAVSSDNGQGMRRS